MAQNFRDLDLLATTTVEQSSSLIGYLKARQMMACTRDRTKDLSLRVDKPAEYFGNYRWPNLPFRFYIFKKLGILTL